MGTGLLFLVGNGSAVWLHNCHYGPGNTGSLFFFCMFFRFADFFITPGLMLVLKVKELEKGGKGYEQSKTACKQRKDAESKRGRRGRTEEGAGDCDQCEGRAATCNTNSIHTMLAVVDQQGWSGIFFFTNLFTSLSLWCG